MTTLPLAILQPMISQRKQLVFFYSVALLALTLFNLSVPYAADDSPIYFAAGEALWHGQMDCLRTPIYPLLLHLLSLPWGMKGCFVLVTILQSILYIVSIWFMHDTARRLIDRQWIADVATLMYILSPAASWCNQFLTESLSLSLTVITTHQVVALMQRPSWRRGLGISLLVLLLVMLRPNFVTLCLIIPCIWAILWFRTRKPQLLVCALSMLIPLGAYLSYCKTYEREFGRFSPSISVDCCKMFLLQACDCWDTLCLDSEEARKFCRYKASMDYNTYIQEYKYIQSHKDAQLYTNICNRMIEAHPREYYRQKAFFVGTSLGDPFTIAVSTYSPLSGAMVAYGMLYPLHVNALFLTSIAIFILLVAKLFRKQPIPLITTFLWAFVASYCLGIALTASDSFGRLLQPSLPAMLLLLGMCANKKTL